MMDVGKQGRRRVHYAEFEEVNHFKRRRKRELEQETTNSVEILGESHIAFDSSNLLGDAYCISGTNHKRCISNDLTNGHHHHHHHHNHSTSRVHPGQDCLNSGQFHSRSRLVNAHSASTHLLSSNLKESERMLFVQRWINQIPAELPLWMQTSINKIVPISHPHSYPVDDFGSGSHESNSNMMLNGFERHSPPKYATPISSTVAQSSVLLQNTSSAPIMGVLGPRFPMTGTTQSKPFGEIDDQQRDVSHRTRMHYLAPNGDSLVQPSSVSNGILRDGIPSIGRLFDDAEIQIIVKLFRDYFTKGSCPILKEVRNRITNTVLESKRTPMGIRAKIKRLQKSGRWTDYTGI